MFTCCGIHRNSATQLARASPLPAGGTCGKAMVDFIQRFKAHRGDERNIVVSGSKNNSECIYEVLRDDNALLCGD